MSASEECDLPGPDFSILQRWIQQHNTYHAEVFSMKV